MMWTTKRALRAENADLRGQLTRMRDQLTRMRDQLTRMRDQRDDARDDVETERDARREACRIADDLSDRLLTLTAQHAALQGRYDAAVGMDAPGVEAGRGWQSRRTDRPTGAEPSPPAGAGDRLPVREPGRAAS